VLAAQLAATMKQYRTNLAKQGFPSSATETPWPGFDSTSQRMLSLIPPATAT
jgi:hypothetical protein